MHVSGSVITLIFLSSDRAEAFQSQLEVDRVLIVDFMDLLAKK
jgi:hypothetical protein